jgi:hypothetical protein
VRAGATGTVAVAFKIEQVFELAPHVSDRTGHSVVEICWRHCLVVTVDIKFVDRVVDRMQLLTGEEVGRSK